MLKSSVAGILSNPFGPWICATSEISFAQQAQLPQADLQILGLLGSISFISYFKTAKFKKSRIKSKFTRRRFQAQVFQEQDFKIKSEKRIMSPNIASQPKKEVK